MICLCSLRFPREDIKLMTVGQSMTLAANQRTKREFSAASGTAGDELRADGGHECLAYDCRSVRALYVKRCAGCELPCNTQADEVDKSQIAPYISSCHSRKGDASPDCYTTLLWHRAAGGC